MMTIKTILFDFGGVLYLTPDMKWVRRWKVIFGIGDNSEIMEMLENPNESQIIKDVCLGRISEEHTWDMVAEKWHIKPEFVQRIRQKAFSKRNMNKPMVQFLADLHKSYQTGILSNAGDQTRHVMEDIFHLDRFVDDIIISAEEGIIKPDRRIYQIALDRLGAEPDTTLFVDDYPANVKGARDLGMKAVHFIDNKQAMQHIQTYLDNEKA
jgi:putative hydrolase of the HAD superfamily